MTDLYAVIGHPIAHSKSPLIHTAFAKQTNQDIAYERVLAPLDGFAQTVQALIQKGYKGVNVTVPFKFEAFNLAHHHSASATQAQAANTLIFNDGKIYADNTDGIGLVSDIIQNQGVKLANKNILLLGAGGAAEGVALPIVESVPALFVIANRSLEKAKAIADKFKSATVAVKCSKYEDLSGMAFDIIINATSTGLTDTILPLPSCIFAKGSLAYEMMYGTETPFMTQAREAGAIVQDGLGMLVEQAAEAFYLWRGVRPDTAAVMAMLRSL